MISAPAISGNTRSKLAPRSTAPSPIPVARRRRRPMRISDAIRFGSVATAILIAAPALAFDNQQTPAAASMPGSVAPLAPTPGGVPAVPERPTPFEAFRSGTQAYLAGEKGKALTELRYAAEQGDLPAQWKIGRMYAEGDGVKRDDKKAFE